MGAFAAGETAALETLYLRYKKPVYSWIVRMTGDAAESEDLYHEAWFRIARAAGRYKADSFKAWLWRIVRNLVIDAARKKRPVLILDAPLEDGCGEDGETTLADVLPDPAGNIAGESLDDEKTKAAMAEAVAALPPTHREVILLRTVSCLSFREIAELLHVPAGTVLARMHRATAKLRAHVKEKRMRGAT